MIIKFAFCSIRCACPIWRVNYFLRKIVWWRRCCGFFVGQGDLTEFRLHFSNWWAFSAWVNTIVEALFLYFKSQFSFQKSFHPDHIFSRPLQILKSKKLCPQFHSIYWFISRFTNKQNLSDFIANRLHTQCYTILIWNYNFKDRGEAICVIYERMLYFKICV